MSSESFAVPAIRFCTTLSSVPWDVTMYALPLAPELILAIFVDVRGIKDEFQ